MIIRLLSTYSMRPKFFEELYRLMKENDRLYALTGDLGYGGFDTIKYEYDGRRFINCGASEQAMMGIAVGLALDGKIPFVYSISPFLLWRAAETIRLYVDHEKIPVIMVGSGRDRDYKHDGFSHDASDIPQFMALFKNIKTYYPNDSSQIKGMLESIIADPKPSFISLRR